ncbi:hypothetical protein HMPREF1548_06068, partial [Clostridium sp. KLE 1755]
PGRQVTKRAPHASVFYIEEKEKGLEGGNFILWGFNLFHYSFFNKCRCIQG